MPTYTVRRADVEDGKQWEVYCSYIELVQMCEEYKLEQVLSTPKIVSGTGSLTSKTDDGWKDHLKRIKENSGRGNTIKV
jgi:hypothetical protein